MPRFIAILSLAFLLGATPAAAETVSIDPPADPVAVVAPSVAVSLTPSPTSVAVGQDVTYTLVVTNNGDVPLTNLSASFDLPVGFSYAAGTPADPLKDLGPLAPGASITKTFNLKVGSNATAGRIPLEVLVAAKEFGPNETVAVVNVQAGQVLGAATLVETGTSQLPFIICGALLILFGAVIFRRRLPA